MNCKWIEALLAVLIIIFANSSWVYATWIIIIAAAVLLIHALTCKTCHVGHRVNARTSRRR